MKSKTEEMGRRITISAKDGFPLAATLFPASNRSATEDRLLIINCATATPQTFYFPLADYLASKGITVLTYDYRGIGRSRPPGSLAKVEATMRSWAALEVSAVLDWTAHEFPSHHLMALGHSYGGQVLGLLPNAHRIERTVLIASQLGYWGIFNVRYRLRAWFGVSVLIPGLSHIKGYFPGSHVGLGEDLPKGVALEWARWCRSPHYLFDHLTPEELAGYARYAAPMLAFKFTDDTFTSGDTVERLLAYYPNAHPKLRTVSPSEVGLKRIGHFGFFRSQCRESLWPELLAWLEEPFSSTSTTLAAAGS